MKQQIEKRILFFHILTVVEFSIVFFILYFLKFGIIFINNYFVLFLLSALFLIMVNTFLLNFSKRVYLNRISKWYFFIITFPLSLFIFSFSFLYKEGSYSRTFIIMLLLFYAALLIVTQIINKWLVVKFSLGSPNKAIIVGAGRLGKELLRIMQKSYLNNIQVIGFLDDNNKGLNQCNEKILGKISDFPDVLKKYDYEVDQIYITIPLRIENKIEKIIQLADYYGIQVFIVPNYFSFKNIKFSSFYVGDIPIIKVRDVPLDSIYNKFEKRLFDILFSLFVIIFLLPLMIVVALLIKVTSKGSVFFIPERIGLNRKRFKMYKFRSMRVTSLDVYNNKSTEHKDKRITKVGRVIRKLNIDELPQFLNVLRGNMSVVGPRPHRLNLDEEFIKEFYSYRYRQAVKPGITGWAQVNGFRGPTDTYNKRSERSEYDLYYIKNWDFLFDLKIIFLTIFGKKVRKNCF